MTLVNIDLRNQGYETGPDDRVIFYSLLVREGEFGTISTAPVEVPLVDGKATVDLAPGPVGVQIIAGQIADTRVKIGEVPPSGPTTLNAVMMVTPAYTPALQAAMIAAIERARDESISDVDRAAAAAIVAAIRPLQDAADAAQDAANTAQDAAQHADTRASAAESIAAQALNGVVIAQNSATSAALSATSANSRVGLAVSNSDNAVSRVEALEALGGLSPESPVDGQTANLLSQPGTLTRGVLDGAYAERARAVEALPLTDVTITPRGDSPIPTDFFDGVLWGVSNNDIHASTDGGITWSFTSKVSGVTNIQRVMKASDGEVIAASTTEVKRSTGWGTGSITWETVLTNPTPSFFHPWGISGDGQKFIIVHYSGSGVSTPDRADSRYGWISTDQGRTWTIVWDTNVKFGEERGVLTHIHACEYDPWEDRFFIAEGHEPDMTGVYVSYDDGATWGKITYGKSFDNPPGNAPTVVKATDYGVVFGSDDPTNGIMVMPRGANTIERAYSRRGVSNTTLMGYAHMGARDPRTGQVYLVWELNEAYASDLGAQIMASDGRVAGPVWEDTDTARRLWRRIVIDDQGNLLAWEQVTNSVLRARVTGIGVIPAHMYDAGRVLGGKTSGVRGTIAVGPEAVATGNRAVAVGLGQVDGFDGVAIGDAIAGGNYSMAIGTKANASNGGVAVGRGTATNGGAVVGYLALGGHSSSVAVGREAQAAIDGGATNPSTTAIGYRAKANASAGEATAVGREAEASGSYATAVGSRVKAVNVRSTVVGAEAVTSLSNRSTVIGSQASAESALGGTAVGAGAKTLHTNAVALGSDVVTESTNSVSVGARHIHMQPIISTPSAPTTGAVLYVRDVGGVMSLCCRIAGGAEIVIAPPPPPAPEPE